MSRAAFLPSSGDPLCFIYWLHWFKLSCANDIDHLYVVMSNTTEEAAQLCNYMLGKSGIPYSFKWTDVPIQHGDALAQMTQLAKEDYVVFLEEDTAIFVPTALDTYFRVLESGDYDAIGSPRDSCTSWIVEASKQKYGIVPGDQGEDTGVNFWPCFLFVKREDLLRTDMEFNAKAWKEGDQVGELGTAPEYQVGDTFVWGSIQLRQMGLRIGYCKQKHGHPDDLINSDRRTGVFDGTALWVHHGSLSSYGMLFDENHQVVVGVDIGEMARRCQWWRTFVDYAQGIMPDVLPDYCAAYRAGIYRIMNLYGIQENDLAKRQRVYQRLFGGKV